MSDFKFSCLTCGQGLVCDVAYGGRQTNCPSCNAGISIPSFAIPPLLPPVHAFAAPPPLPWQETGDPGKRLTARFIADGAALTLSFDPAEVIRDFSKVLSKRLFKKGIVLDWSDESENPDLLIRLVAMDEGNQFLRWLLPFVAPAVLEVEGHVAVRHKAPQQFHYVQRAQMAVAGGTSRYMLNVCATRSANKIATSVLSAFLDQQRGSRP